MPFKNVDSSVLEEMKSKNKNSDRINQLVDTSLINKAKEKSSSIIRNCDKLHHYIKIKDIESLEKCSSQLIRTSQDLTQLLRSLPINFGFKESISYVKSELANDSSLQFSIEDDDILKIVLDSHFPRRLGSKICESLDYIRSCYALSFEEYFRNHSLKYSGRVVIVYLNYFSDISKIIDDDNFDTKIITDFITQYVLIDDNPTRCAKIYDYRIGTYNHSEVLVVPMEKINDVFQFQK